MMRKSTQYNLAHALVISAVALVLLAGVFALGFLLQEFLDEDVAVVITLGLGFAVALGIVFAAIVYALRSSHRSWKANLARYPALKPAIERYREEGEGVRRLLPAFEANRSRYFLVKYGRKNREWAPDKHETGMVVLDEHGRVQDDEQLFESLLRSVRYVEESYLHDSLRFQEDIMAGGRRMEREVAEARQFFSGLVGSAGQPELIEDIDAFLTMMAGHFHRLVTVIEGEYEWCRKNRKRVEFTLEEMKPLEKVRKETALWDIETARKLARTWAKVEGQRARLESLPSLSGYDRARMRKLLDSFRISAKALSGADHSMMQVLPERIEAYRSRTAKALRLEAQAQPAASAA